MARASGSSGLVALTPMSSDAPREPRAPRRAKPRQSLKMQAIGFLSRREHSRQELRAKLLESLRKRAREDAALAAAAEESAKAAQAQPSNGIDDAFAPRAHAPVPEPASERARVSRAGARSRGGLDAGAGMRLNPRNALDTLTLASGAALPSRLKASLSAAAAAGAVNSAATAASEAFATPEDADAPDDADLERSDPEAAVEQLLDWLVAHKYLSDARFVESRVNARSRKQGTLRIKLELSRHGLALEPDQAATLRETEFARARELWQRKFGEVAADPRQRAKQARFLAARGFAADVVRRVVGGLDED
jgi:regulatory protein